MPSKDYMAEYREKNQAYVELQNKRKRAREKALRELAKVHQAEFMRLFKYYLKEEGVDDA